MLLLNLKLIIGLLLVIYGADALVDGASSIARKAGLSEFIIGMTIVGIGTSMPELVVCLNGAVNANSAIAVGNIIGSNAFNTLIILGLSTLISPIAITASNRKVDMPLNLISAVILTVFGLMNGLSRLDGIIFLLLFGLYMAYSFKYAGSPQEDEKPAKTRSVLAAGIFIILGIAGLIAGGQMFVNSASEIAHSIGVSDKVIAVTVLAIGTSLPELATCVVASAKGHNALALGNVIGSNISNIFLILGISALVHPLSFGVINTVDFAALFAGALILIIGAFTFKKNKLDRFEGALLFLMGIAYVVLQFIMN